MAKTAAGLDFRRPARNMECCSQLFVRQMQKLLDGPTPLPLTVAMRGSGLIALLKQARGRRADSSYREKPRRAC